MGNAKRLHREDAKSAKKIINHFSSRFLRVLRTFAVKLFV